MVTIKPTIFPKEVLAGITQKNIEIFPEKGGFSITKAEILNEEEVREHRTFFANFLNIPLESVKFQNQVHGKAVRRVDAHSTTENSDAMITSERGILLCLSLADCGGILLFDPVHHAIGAVHSGWKGTALNITGETIGAMTREFGSNPADILAYLTPCASGKNYEVEADVAGQFPAEVLTKISDKKFLFDNPKMLCEQMISAGILQKNIEISDLCTIEDERFHSFRRDGAQSGRMAAFIGLFS